MNPRLYYICFLIFIYFSPLNSEFSEDEEEFLEDDEDGFFPPRHGKRHKRATGDPKATLVKRIREIFSTLLTEQQINEVADLAIGTYFKSGADMAALQAALMPWAMSHISQFMPVAMPFLGLPKAIGDTDNTKTPNLVGSLVTVMKNNLMPFGTQVIDKINQCKAKGKSQNATVRAVCIMCLRFFKQPTVQKIIDRIKKNFSPTICDAISPLLGSVMLIDLYKFKDTPCTGTNDGSQCTPTPCTPIDVMSMVGGMLGKK